MKKFLLIFLVSILPFLVFAHPPEEIKISYDLVKKEVYIEIIHNVKSPVEHYIYEMELFINGKKVIRQDTKAQFDNLKQKVIYLIPELKEGDKLSFWAECNKGGDKKKEIVISKKEGKK